MRRHTTASRRRAPRPAFTLIELLVVISIIVVLLGLASTAGLVLIRDRTRAVTESILQTLDRALQSYTDETGSDAPPYHPAYYNSVPGQFLRAGGEPNNSSDAANEYPAGSGVFHVRHPDAAVFLWQARGVAGVSEAVNALPPRFVVPTPTTGTRDVQQFLNAPNPSSAAPTGDSDPTPSVLDAWGDADEWAASTSDSDETAHWPLLDAQVIYFVHPANRLAQDLYGRCVNRRPYFFSAGPDRLYGTSSQNSPDGSAQPGGSEDSKRALLEALKDNVYSYPVGPALGADDPNHAFNNDFR